MRIDAASAAYHAYTNANRANSALTENMSKLASGLRITKAADDAAGLAISEKMKSQIAGQQMQLRNAQDVVSLSQVREGAMAEISDSMQRTRELVVQGSNSTYSSEDKQIITNEINQLSTGINDTIKTTEFNGSNVFANTNVGAWQISDIGFQDEAMTATSLQNIDQALTSLTSERTSNAAIENSSTAAINVMTTALENTTSAESRITDLDMARERMNMTSNLIKQQAALSVMNNSNVDARDVLSLLK